MKKSNWHGGKGSGRRGSDDKKYADNWEQIFGKPRDNINSRESGDKNGTNTETTDSPRRK
jgi:hypothetical protein